MKKIILSVFLMLSFFVLKAQERNVTGKVTAADSEEPIPGVSVLVKGTNTGTITDLDGNFSLSVPPRSGILVFSYLGYASQERTIGNEGVVDVILAPD